MKRNVLYEFIHKHRKIEKIIEKYSWKYRQYIINQSFKVLRNTLTKEI